MIAQLLFVALDKLIFLNQQRTEGTVLSTAAESDHLMLVCSVHFELVLHQLGDRALHLGTLLLQSFDLVFMLLSQECKS